MNPDSAYRQLKKILAKAGSASIRFHDLCHTFSTVSPEHSMDVKTLSTIIGHVSSSTTLNVYTHSKVECKESLAKMIVQVKAEIAAEKERMGHGSKAS